MTMSSNPPFKGNILVNFASFANAVPSPQELMTLTRGKTCRGGLRKEKKIKTVVFDASFANARPKSCYEWFCLTCKENLQAFWNKETLG